VGGARALRVAPPGVEKYPSTMSLKALLCSLLIDAARISDGGLICRQLVFFFPSLLLVFKLQSFIFLISNFWYWPFCRIFICF
jgi:hypothetical protein